MANILAKIISAITSPFLVIPVVGLWVTSVYTNTTGNFLALGASFVVCIVLLPFVYIYNEVKHKRFTDFHVAVREQREKPFLISIFGAILLLLAYHFQNAPREGMELATLLLVNGIVFYLITRYWKISVHAATFFGSILVISIFINPEFILLAILTPLIIWARLKRRRHSLPQAISSLVIIGMTTFLVHYFFLVS